MAWASEVEAALNAARDRRRPPPAARTATWTQTGIAASISASPTALSQPVPYDEKGHVTT